MAICAGCSAGGCTCVVDGVTITGAGTPGDPFIAGCSCAVDGVTITGAGTPGDPFVAGGGGGDAFMTVAAFDTPAVLADFADFVCGGANDQVGIQAALDLLDVTGGTVHLLPGTFNTTAAIVLDSDQWLLGSGGRSSNIVFSGAGYAITAVFEDQIGIERLSVESTIAAGATVSISGQHCSIVNCYLLQNSPASTIAAVVIAGDGSQIIGCHIVGSDLGITISDGASYVEIGGNYIEAETTILIDGADFCTVHDNRLRGSGAASGDGITIRGSADDNTITNNVLTDYGDNGIRLINVGAATPDRNNIQGNTCRQLGGGDDYGINILSGTANLVTNNDLLNSGTLPINDAGTATITAAGNRL